MADFNYTAPTTPVAPAAPEKKPLPIKLIAIVAVALVAVIVLISIIAGGVPGKVKKELKDVVEDTYGYNVKGLDVELKVSKDGAKMLLISGRFKGEIEDEDFEEFEDYKDGYFTAMAITYKDEVVVEMSDIYEKDDKDDFKDALKEAKEDFDSDEKEEAKEMLAAIAEVMEEEDCELEEALFLAALASADL